MPIASPPPIVSSSLSVVRDRLGDIRRSAADIERLTGWDTLVELPGQLADRATGRRRRQERNRWLALGVAALIVAAMGAVLATLMIRRRRQNDLADEIDSELEALAGEDLDKLSEDVAAQTGAASPDDAVPDSDTASNTSDTNATEAEKESFPASDPAPTPMTPGLG